MTFTLLTFEAAARQLNVPVASLRAAADEHGLTIRMGRAIRIHPDDLGRLIELCREEPKDRAYSGAKTDKPGKSETRAAPVSRPALAAAERLKRSLRTTSPSSTAPVVPLNRKS